MSFTLIASKYVRCIEEEENIREITTTKNLIKQHSYPGEILNFDLCIGHIQVLCFRSTAVLFLTTEPLYYCFTVIMYYWTIGLLY